MLAALFVQRKACPWSSEEFRTPPHPVRFLSTRVTSSLFFRSWEAGGFMRQGHFAPAPLGGGEFRPTATFLSAVRRGCDRVWVTGAIPSLQERSLRLEAIYQF